MTVKKSSTTALQSSQKSVVVSANSSMNRFTQESTVSVGTFSIGTKGRILPRYSRRFQLGDPHLLIYIITCISVEEFIDALLKLAPTLTPLITSSHTRADAHSADARDDRRASPPVAAAARTTTAHLTTASTALRVAICASHPLSSPRSSTESLLVSL